MFINELDAFCIVLPPNLCPFTCPDHLRYLAISGTEAQPFAHERIQYRAVGTGLPMEPPSALIRRICSERAIDTVGGMLRVEGLEISPESYLKRWRNRLAQPITPEQLALSKQLQAIAIFEWRHTEAIGDRKATWRDPPFATFGDLLAARGFPGGPAVRQRGWPVRPARRGGRPGLCQQPAHLLHLCRAGRGRQQHGRRPCQAGGRRR